MPKTLYTNISQLVTNLGVAKKGGVGVVEEDLGIIENAALLWDAKGGIQWMGPMCEMPTQFKKTARKIHLKGRTLTPALSDCHTHLVYGGNRDHELALRLAGASYQQIAASGGGMQSTVTATRATSEAELFRLGARRLEAMANLGVGIVEIKSGYGLNWASERKILQVIKRLKLKFKDRVIIKSTFLGAHSFPPEAKTKSQRDAYVDEVVDKMLPAVAKEKFADACDVFFDEGYFNLEQSRRILQAAQSHGLEIKLHADELADNGGAALSAELGALSADHLLKANAHGIERMAKRGVVATLLPGTAFYLGVDYAPLEQMRRAGVCFALATDFNPGSSPTLNLPFIMSLACLGMGMTMPESFAAATYGSARALGLHAEQGHLRVGAKPRFSIFNCESYQALIAQIAHPSLVARHIIDGRTRRR